jgi:hypothetical protein
MNSTGGNNGKYLLNDPEVAIIRRRARIVMLLDAAERAGIAPINAIRLHAFSYLADVLSPVWDLPPFDGKILKIEGGPHYPDIQQEIDRLVVLGLVEVSNLRYLRRPNGGARIACDYSLRLDSKQLPDILFALGARAPFHPLDPKDQEVHAFLVDLAGALALLPGEQIEKAATLDATYADSRIGDANLVDFASWTNDPGSANLSVLTAERFSAFLPEESRLSPGERIYLYASYLGRKINVR